MPGEKQTLNATVAYFMGCGLAEQLAQRQGVSPQSLRVSVSHPYHKQACTCAIAVRCVGLCVPLHYCFADLEQHRRPLWQCLLVSVLPAVELGTALILRLLRLAAVHVSRVLTCFAYSSGTHLSKYTGLRWYSELARIM